LDPAVETVYDRVPNVRLQLTTLLPRFKELICLPQVRLTTHRPIALTAYGA
jgi:hypothetical protein